jgi:hypothetical protein
VQLASVIVFLPILAGPGIFCRNLLGLVGRQEELLANYCFPENIVHISGVDLPFPIMEKALRAITRSAFAIINIIDRAGLFVNTKNIRVTPFFLALN